MPAYNETPWEDPRVYRAPNTLEMPLAPGMPASPEFKPIPLPNYSMPAMPPPPQLPGGFMGGLSNVLTAMLGSQGYGPTLQQKLMQQDQMNRQAWLDGLRARAQLAQIQGQAADINRMNYLTRSTMEQMRANTDQTLLENDYLPRIKEADLGRTNLLNQLSRMDLTWRPKQYQSEIDARGMNMEADRARMETEKELRPIRSSLIKAQTEKALRRPGVGALPSSTYNLQLGQAHEKEKEAAKLAQEAQYYRDRMGKKHKTQVVKTKSGDLVVDEAYVIRKENRARTLQAEAAAIRKRLEAGMIAESNNPDDPNLDPSAAAKEEWAEFDK